MTSSATRASSHPALAAPLTDWRAKFLLLALVWGSSFLLIKIGTEALTPMQITLGRMAAGAIPLAGVLLLRRGRLPRSPRTWLHLSVAALLLNVVPFTLFGYAEQIIPSALAGICNATTPLFALVFSMLLLTDERPSGLRLAGLATGFVGVLVVFGVWTGITGAGNAGMFLAVAATVCYGIGTPYLRRFLGGTPHSALELSTGQLIAGTAQLAVVAPVVDGAPTTLPPRVLLAVAVLGALGTGLAYVLQYAIIRDAGATVASTVTYVVPVVAVAAGMLLLGETLAWHHPVGALIVIAGAALSRARRRRL